MSKHGVNVVVGIPSFGMVSTFFMQARLSQQFPLVSSAVDKVVLNKPIAEARNEIVEYALMQGANYIYWLDGKSSGRPSGVRTIICAAPRFRQRMEVTAAAPRGAPGTLANFV